MHVWTMNLLWLGAETGKKFFANIKPMAPKIAFFAAKTLQKNDGPLTGGGFQFYIIEHNLSFSGQRICAIKYL